MKAKAVGKTKPIHRSFSLDAELVAEARRLAPPELSGNLNRMMNVALADLVEGYRRLMFEAEMARMASDPALARESAEMAQHFEAAEFDGL